MTLENIVAGASVHGSVVPDSADHSGVSSDQFDQKIRSVVGIDLSSTDPNQRRDAIAFLEKVDPRYSANYLVGALKQSESREAASAVLMHYGACRATANPLVGALKDPLSRDAAAGVLKQYGPYLATANVLVGIGLRNMASRDYAIDILTEYGASRVTLKPLFATLGDVEFGDAVVRVFKKYGPTKVTIEFVCSTITGTTTVPRRTAAVEILKEYSQVEPKLKRLVDKFDNCSTPLSYVQIVKQIREMYKIR